ncbi:hypothetical protein TGAM01_v206249 [Trichoderma gamsii]|uniref:Uncharacterized protein n=1 Tax=Trichoderma gamsii TaxID=398673 RepID=A0A2P4ZKB3_9HYPO|nr:hypothetical protein TGAM01_v206249 [Trichoderma gamsii]PON24741.1 hypothetical protein TGAM01_v206249 [Trichoderma gamsii]
MGDRPYARLDQHACHSLSRTIQVLLTHATYIQSPTLVTHLTPSPIGSRSAQRYWLRLRGSADLYRHTGLMLLPRLFFTVRGKWLN